MSRFSGKKLPPHWLYVPSRREIRVLFQRLAIDVRCVDFDGTGSGLRSGTLLLGYLERRVVDEMWCFYLRLWGVPESAVEGRRDELATAAIQASGQSVAECLAISAADVVDPTQLLLWFKVGAEGFLPECKVKAVDRYSFSAGPWWVCPSPA